MRFRSLINSLKYVVNADNYHGDIKDETRKQPIKVQQKREDIQHTRQKLSKQTFTIP